MMTRVQYEKQNKDLRIRLENLKIVKQISEDNLNSIIQKLKADLRSKDEQIRMLQSYIATREETYNCLEDKYTALKEKYSELLERYESQTEAIDFLKARINKDSSNSNKPSSTDGYKKIIHNSRKPSDKKPGGQPGH